MLDIKSTYHVEWTTNRINYIHKFYPVEFFAGKTILELGCNFADIGAYFTSLGATVTSVEGRENNISDAKNLYPAQNIVLGNLDTPDWTWGNFDIIVNFGLFYHLENYHREHLINCVNNCNLMFFETVVLDSTEDTLFFQQEIGGDQSLTERAGVPTTSFVENIFTQQNVLFDKHTSNELNANSHHYDWLDTDSRVPDRHSRRMWVVRKP